MAREIQGTRERPIYTEFNLLWSAYFRDEYCGCGTCHPLIGFGSNEAQAVADLQEQAAEQDEDSAAATEAERQAIDDVWRLAFQMSPDSGGQ